MKKLINASLNSTNRHNLFVIKCSSNQLSEIVNEITEDSISSINIGQEIANGLSDKDSKYLTIKVQELLNYSVQKNAVESFLTKPKVITLYNFGILFEPSIQLNVVKVLTELSKQYGIIIIWDAFIEEGPILHWGNQKETFQINLSDINPLIIDKTL